MVNISGHGDGRELISSPPVPLQIVKTAKLRDSKYRFRVIPATKESSSRTSGSPSNKPSILSTPKKTNSVSNPPPPLPPSPSSREEYQGQSLPNATPSIKKGDNNRSASPAPSKKSISSPPPPPNLVLPTWQHTFHTAPRNVVPVNVKPLRFLDDQGLGGKLLGKTMRFVSGVLFSRDGQDGSSDPVGR